MKFVVCTNCKDIIVPQQSRKKCSCKMTTCHSVEGITHYSGQFAIAKNFKDEWFTDDVKGKDNEAVLKTGKKKEEGADRDFCTKVIEYLNQVAGTGYSIKFPSSASDLILGRRADHGCIFDDFQRIIDNKWQQWKGTDREKFMRPETLFGKTKFLSYFGERSGNGEQSSDSNNSATTRSVKDLLSGA